MSNPTRRYFKQNIGERNVLTEFENEAEDLAERTEKLCDKVKPIKAGDEYLESAFTNLDAAIECLDEAARMVQKGGHGMTGYTLDLTSDQRKRVDDIIEAKRRLWKRQQALLLLYSDVEYVPVHRSYFDSLVRGIEHGWKDHDAIISTMRHMVHQESMAFADNNCHVVHLASWRDAIAKFTVGKIDRWKLLELVKHSVVPGA